MSAHPGRFAGSAGGAHPVVASRRLHEIWTAAIAGAITVALSMAITVATPEPNPLLIIGLIVGAGVVVWLVATPRLELSVAAVALFLGLLDGPVKLGTGGHELASVVRDILIAAVSIGAIVRLMVSRNRVRLPAMSQWALGYAGLVVLEAFNPRTENILKVLGGFRQQLEWVPFFFFGYVLMRSKGRFVRLFLILGVVALANGAVSTYQTRLSPAQIASWGPGYKEIVYGSSGGVSGRKYISEGVAHVRPLGLGSDSGFGGGVGVIALPGTLALMALGPRRRRIVGGILCLGAMVAIITCLGRLQLVGGFLSFISFAGLATSAGRRFGRPLVAMLGIIALAIPLGILFISVEGEGTFSRYSSVAPGSVAQTSTSYKEKSWAEIPREIEEAPFGVGLGTAGAASGFGGKIKGVLNGHNVSSETQYNFVTNELGLPGLLLWFSLAVSLIYMAVTRLRHIADIDLRICLMAVFAPVIALFLMAFDGPVMASAASGPFFWFATGVAGYWFVGPGRRRAMFDPVAPE